MDWLTPAGSVMSMVGMPGVYTSAVAAGAVAVAHPSDTMRAAAAHVATAPLRVFFMVGISLDSVCAGGGPSRRLPKENLSQPAG